MTTPPPPSVETDQSLTEFVEGAVADANAAWDLRERHTAGDHSACPPEWCQDHILSTYQTAFGWGWGCSCGRFGAGNYARSQASAYAYGSRHVAVARRRNRPEEQR